MSELNRDSGARTLTSEQLDKLFHSPALRRLFQENASDEYALIWLLSKHTKDSGSEKIYLKDMVKELNLPLPKVTAIARSIVMRFGMHEALGNVAYDSDKTNFLGQAAPQAQERSYSEETAREIDCAVREIVARAFERSSAILASRRPLLEESARDLLARETLDEADLKAIHDRATAG